MTIITIVPRSINFTRADVNAAANAAQQQTTDPNWRKAIDRALVNLGHGQFSFEQLAGRIAVCISITTDDETVRRIFEPACAPIRARVDALRAVREAGIPTQASIAPLLPCNAERLAALLDPAVDWVVVSTFRDDGGSGGKTRDWAAQLYRQHGYGDYLHDGDAHATATIETLRRLLGPERVRVGKDGFDQVCRELGVDQPESEQLSLFS
jgi:hypothetical protein